MSLVELLVGLAILAVLLASAVLAFPRSDARRAELESERVLALLQHACERAELGGFDIGIAIGAQSLAFGPWREGGWQVLAASPNEVLRPRALAAGGMYSLEIDQRRVALPRDPPDRPQLTCASDGLLPPFVLAMSGPGTTAFRLVSDGVGGLRRERVDVR